MLRRHIADDVAAESVEIQYLVRNEQIDGRQTTSEIFFLRYIEDSFIAKSFVDVIIGDEIFDNNAVEVANGNTAGDDATSDD